jgi:hypothetical protein
MQNREDIQKIELKKDESYTAFVRNNERQFLDLIIVGIEKLAEDEKLDVYIAFTVFGGKLKKDRDIVVQRDGIHKIIENALGKMELNEEYEICNHLIELQEKFK